MSAVVVFAPLIVAGWPVITAAVTAAIGTMGFAVATSAAPQRSRTTTRTEIDVEDSEILQGETGREQSLLVERDGVRAKFTRDARGALKLCMEGTGVSEAELKRIGDELIGAVTQQYVYHRIVSELQERNMTIVDEEVQADRSVKLRVRNF